jgi:hypothetical protein
LPDSSSRSVPIVMGQIPKYLSVFHFAFSLNPLDPIPRIS